MSKPTDARIIADADLAAERLTRVAVAIGSVGDDGLTPLQRITFELADGIKAAAYDRESTSTPMWCWRHERTLDACHREALLCTGERDDGISDPTGTAALEGDRAAQNRRDLVRHLSAITAAVDAVERILGHYPGPRASSLFDQAEADGCQSCARAGVHSDPVTRREVSPGVEWRLCKWCAYSWYDRHSALPSVAVLEARAADMGDGRIRVRANGDVVWRGQVIDHVTPDNGIRELV